MTLKTSMFYAYQDQYGWTVATVTGAPTEAFLAAHKAPRSFSTRASAEAFIQSVCKSQVLNAGSVPFGRPDVSVAGM